ncbi:MAG: class I SAM-dependent methyltransferase [Verrucomicrobiota bacterium]
MKELKVSEDTKDAVAAMYRPPAWAAGPDVGDDPCTGYVSEADARFLWEFLLRERPRRVVEVGCAAGVSTSVLLAAMAEVRRREGEEVPRLDVFSFDVMKQCYFDENRRVGSAVKEMVPDLAGNVLFCLGEHAHRAGRYFGEGSVEVVFIDANHRHPYPTLDLMSVLPILAPKAWVVLHDIGLPDITKRAEWREYGPQYLFEGWVGERLIAETTGEEPANIGAIRMPGRVEDAVPALQGILKGKEWEEEPVKGYLERAGLGGMVERG